MRYISIGLTLVTFLISTGIPKSRAMFESHDESMRRSLLNGTHRSLDDFHFFCPLRWSSIPTSRFASCSSCSSSLVLRPSSRTMPVCPQCDNRQFANKEALLQHMKSSSAWHPFCSICDRRFVSETAFEAVSNFIFLIPLATILISAFIPP
jgi:hypothetical protein